jgi:hypothetical protein
MGNEKVITTLGVAGPTYEATAANTKASISASVLNDANSRRIVGMTIECDIATGYGLRYAYGGTAPTNASMHTLLPGQVLQVTGYANCKSFQYINDTDDENAVLVITPFY